MYEYYITLGNLSYRLDNNGKVTRVNYSSQVRDSVFQAQSVSEVKAFYKALSLFDTLANKKENHIVYKLEQGKYFGLSFGFSMLS